MKQFFLILSVLIVSPHYAKASDDNEKESTVHGWQIGGMYHRGKMHNHSSFITPIIERSAVGGEIFLSKQTHGAHSWNSFYNYPEYGVSYTFLDVGSPTYVGNVHCLFPYLNFHFLNNKSRINFNLKTGAGIAYVDKIFNVESNPLNHAFSTNFNIVLNAQLQSVCRISNSVSLFAGAGIIHLSNGAYRMPNLGLNTLSIFSGISQSFGKENRLIPSGTKINEKNKNWNCSVFLLGGVKEINPIGGKKYFAGDFNVEVTKKQSRYTCLGLSLDVTYDASEYDCIIFQSLPPVDRLKTTRIGVSGGYVWLFGDFSLDLYLGTYLYEENALYGKIYQRTSLRYPLSDRIKVSLSFRNHKGKADFIGLGFGVSLTK